MGQNNKQMRGRTRHLSIEKGVSVALAALFVVVLGVFCVGSISREAASQAQRQGYNETAGVTSEGASSSSGSQYSHSATNGAASSSANASSGNSKAAEGAATAGQSESQQSTVIDVVTKKPRHSVIYSWENAPDPQDYLTDSHGSRIFINLPPSIEVREDETFVPSVEYPKGFKAYKRSETGELVGVFTFDGWDLEGEQTMGKSNVVVTGSWSYKEESSEPVTSTYAITYAWTDAPDKTKELFDASGSRVVLTLPVTQTLSEGESFDVDTTYGAKMVVHTRDEYGFIATEYVFSGWNLSGTQIMGASDVLITGSWTFRVPTHKVFYTWVWKDASGKKIDEPDKSVQLFDENGAKVNLALPTTVEKAAGALVEIDTAYTSETVLYLHDASGAVVGRYEFSGWSYEDVLFLEDDDIEITGTWVYYDEA